MDVVAFGDHLGADEEVDVAGVEAGEQALHVVTAADGVAVHAADAGVGEDLLQAFLALLGACAEVVEVFGIALGAAGGYGAPVAAVVALQALAAVGDAGGVIDGFVVGE